MSSETPEGWGNLPLRLLASYVSRGASPSYAPFETGTWAVSQKCVRDGVIDLAACRPHDQLKRIKQTAVLRDGDICVNSTGTGTLGRIALWHGHGRYFADTHVTVVRVDPSKADPAFVTAYLGMASTLDTIYRECVTGSTNQIELSKSAFEELLCPVPPLDEQRRIAEVLRSVDEAIQSAERLADQQHQLWEALVEARAWLPALDDPSKLVPLSKSLSGSDYGVNVPLTDEPVGIPVLRMGNLQGGQIDITNLKWGLVAEAEAQSLQLHDGDILFNRTNSRELVGKVALVRGEPDYLYASYLVRLSVNRTVADPYFVFAVMNSRRGQAALKSIATPGASQANINPTNLKKLDFPLVALPEQVEMSETLKSIEDVRVATLAEVATLRAFQENLTSELLSGRVRVPAPLSVRQKPPVQPAFKRAVFAAEVVHQLHNDARFGSVKHEKIVHLCELHIGLQEDLDRHAYKEAAGPYDPKARRSVETIFRQQKWFNADKSDGKKVVYHPLENCGGHASYFQRYFGDRQAEVQTIIDLLRPMNTQQCEIVVTLYAVWNDFLIDGRQTSDADIVASVLNDWHLAKAQIAEDRWLAALPWMRQHGLIPKGLGEKTRVVAT